MQTAGSGLVGRAASICNLNGHKLAGAGVRFVPGFQPDWRREVEEEEEEEEEGRQTSPSLEPRVSWGPFESVFPSRIRIWNGGATFFRGGHSC